MNKRQLEQLLHDLFIQQPDRTLSFKEVFRTLKLVTHPLKMLAIDIMEEMQWDDFLTKVADNAYKLNTKGQVQEGQFVRKANGKNSFIPDGDDKPIFVAERNSLSAMTGDRVKVSYMARRPNHIREAQVIEVLQRAKEEFVGRLRVDKDIAYCVPQGDNLARNILIPRRKLKGGKTDDKVVVRVVQWPEDEHKTIIGEVIDVLGVTGDNDVEMNTILAQYGLPYKYPKNVEEAANKITGQITPQDEAEREDFRDVWTCTIDPHDAKDFDDALSIRAKGKGCWEVGVHIADVSHYVTEGSIIDREAERRATSIYLVDRTIPMLPEHLCNFICSLRPDEDKLAFSVIFDINDRGEVKAHRIVHTIIRSKRRYAYEEVQQILEDNGVVDGTGQAAPIPGEKGYVGDHGEELCQLDRLAKMLREQRFKNGSVRFDSEELHFDVDDKGHPTRAYFKVSRDANKLVEEWMLLANRTVAESIALGVKKGSKPKTLPYRIHDNPDPQKMETLREFISKFGYKVKTDGTKGAMARSINKLMAECESKPEGKAIQRVALRAMMKARYSVHNIGHFGLAFDHYTHFTSPIRRYPDTLVHRLLTRYAQGGRSANAQHYEDLCEHCSDMEQVAQNAERDSIKYKMVEFMADKLGEVFDAHISGITSYGIYAEIDENHCEGMVPMRDLDDDYYDFDEKNFCLVGRRHHHRYQLGDAVKIQVARANQEKRQLDFALVGEDGVKKKRKEGTHEPDYGKKRNSKRASTKAKKKGRR